MPIKDTTLIKILLPSALAVALTGLLGGCMSSMAELPAVGTDASTSSETESKPNSLAESTSEVIPALNLDAQGRALRGYDAVAYFETGQATLGDPTWSVSWRGAEWNFANSENRAKFIENPTKYAPENGGYCTFGIVLLKKFDIDPTVWLVRNEELYVFLNEEVKEKFLQDEEGNFERVQNNWPLIREKLPEEL